MEREFVRWLQQHAPVRPGTSLGIGDDGSVHPTGVPGQSIAVTTDLLVDGTHFELAHCEPYRVGRKALAVNLSDLAAMAARPVACWISLAVPLGMTESVLHQIYRGLLDLADAHQLTLAGGDTNSTSGPLVISVTAMGLITGSPWTRTGAKAGDRILVTGTLGGSLLGHHFDFQPRLAEALAWHQRYQIHAAMDISDGLTLDLDRMAEASNCGAALQLEHVPISDAAHLRAQTSGLTPLDHALSDGEDFELLMAVPPDVAAKLLHDTQTAIRLTDVGEFIAERGLFARQSDGSLTPLAPRGYLHDTQPSEPVGPSRFEQSVDLHSESDTDRLGAILAAELPESCVVGLIGTLGAGKTRLVRALAEGAGIDSSHVQSPTFVLCHEYHGTNSIYHFDAYRLKNTAEFLDLGAEEYFERPGWTVIEWSDRIQDALPMERIDIEMHVTSEHGRRAVLIAYSPELGHRVQRIAKTFRTP